MPRTRIKICGIRRPEDALHAARCGADAIGLIFHPASPRLVTLEEALAVKRALPPFVATVALFHDAKRAEVGDVLARLKPTYLQFHGAEDPDYCASFGHPYLKAIGVDDKVSGADLIKWSRGFSSAAALLLDTRKAGQQGGGTGQVFDWSVVPTELAPSIVLAGGLNPGNVAGAVRKLRPWAVDVASGVEAGKGVKDPVKVAEFINQVRQADADV